MLERMADWESGPVRRQAELRYRFAAGFIRPQDAVIDAACGTGYGEEILGGRSWLGVDYHEDSPGLVADLRTWEMKFDFDVWVGLETIEHLDVLDNYIAQAQKAKKWIVISTPIVPTKHYNPWHVRDHDAADVERMFGTGAWYLWGMLRQFDTEGFEYGLFAFARR